MDVEIKGTVESGFEKVKEAFAANWQGCEVGAACSVVHKGKKVVDLWGGWLDTDFKNPWQENTLVNVYSTTKGMGSLAMAILADEGKLDYTAKVVDYWPEFGANGKENVTVAQLLSHQAGLCGITQKLTIEDLYDWEKMVRLLAEQKPLWEPGKGCGYHAVTWGYFPGKLTRRITGKSLGTYFREKVAVPLKADFFIGLPDSEMSRTSYMIGANRARIPIRPVDPPPKMPDLYPIALLNPDIRPFKDASSTAWRKAEIAAANGQANARGIARIYGMLANGGEIDGIRILRSKGIEAALIEEVNGSEPNLVTGRNMRFARGFSLNSDEGLYGKNPNAFGHAGAGGSLGFADSSANIGFGYVMNQMQVNQDDPIRSKLLADAVYDCL
ncbi:MAG: beta-lactamase family protein [Desulfobacteraceae bacterium]|nr:beta-lactamase family protein [Desulfobacteraceae bacterium]